MEQQVRTAREFADAGLAVIVECARCDVARRVDPELLVFVVGDDFDMRRGLVELRQQLRCECCGKSQRASRFEEPEPVVEPAEAHRAVGGRR